MLEMLIRKQGIGSISLQESVPGGWLAGSFPQLAHSGFTAALELRLRFLHGGPQSVTEKGGGKKT